MKLIVNADDFGLTNGVTYGILDAMEHGIVTSTTMMVNTPGTMEAARIVRQTPGLPVGLHINISLGSPLTRAPSLTRDGKFQKPGVLGTDEGYDEGELYREMAAQYGRFLELTGRKPTHLDSHLYVHQKFPKVRRALLRLAQEQELPARDLAAGRFPRVRFEGGFKLGPGETRHQLRQKLWDLLDGLGEDGVVEWMVHPAWADAWLLENSSYNIQRTAEHAVLTDPEVRERLAGAAVTPASFQDLE